MPGGSKTTVKTNAPKRAHRRLIFFIFTEVYSLNVAHTGAWSDGFSILRMS